MRPLRILIDGPNLSHRARHAFTDLTDQDDIPTGVVFGSLQALDKLLQVWDPDEIITTWEGTGAPNWRKGIYPEYKGERRKRAAKNRDESEWLAFTEYQEPDLRTALSHMGIPEVVVPGLEADDLIGGIVQPRNRDDSEYLIVSTDKDMLQLAQFNRCKIYNPITEDLYYQSATGELVCSGRGVGEMVLAPSPSTWLIWRAITGDTSDSIKGIEGVGEGTVKKLYGDLRWNYSDPQGYLMNGALEIDGKRGEALRNGTKTVTLNLDLMDLSGSGALLHLEPSYRDAISFIHVCKGLVKHPHRTIEFPNEWPKFLKNADSLKTPLVRFFGVRNFDFVFSHIKRRDWVNQYRTLYNRRQEMYTKGNVFILPGNTIG